MDALLEQWQTGDLHPLIRARLQIPERAPRTAPLPASLSEPTRQMLRQSGIQDLYGHQADAIAQLMQGSDVVVSTPTASGKSLCYALPIIEALATDPRATALLLFPTKALERDQGKELTAMLGQAGVQAIVAPYDGDSTADARRMARSRARVILTNPDMLHLGILPHHTSWGSFLSGLRHVVLDELHLYRGVFGSHVANVIRRFHRVLGFHGARPSWMAASATIRNPGELAQGVIGRRFQLVEESGAPSGQRTVLFMTPRLIDPVSGMRGSYLHLASRVTGDLVTHGLQTLVFAQSRRGVEVALRYVREHVRKQGIEPESVQGYRGGYLPQLRRRIEDGLKTGDLRCVVATNALELGVDIGSLDAVVLAGYPGSVASTWQRIGRAGRRLEPSLAVYVGSSAPLDQYMVSHADWLASASPESGLVNPDNLEILLMHIRCALFELPFETGEPFGGLDGEQMRQVLDHLVAEGEAHHAGRVTQWIADEYPGQAVNLRSIGPEPFTVRDETVGSVLGEVEGRSAYRMLHEQAIYQHAGLPYLVEELDLERRRALVREVDPEYYTQPIVATTITPIDHVDHQDVREMQVHLGEVKIVERVTGFKKIRYGTHENLGAEEADLPELTMEAFAVWLQPSLAALRRGQDVLDSPTPAAGGMGATEDPGSWSDSTLVLPPWVTDGLQGLGELLRQMGSMRLMCDPHDLVGVLGPGQQDWSSPGAGDAALLPALYLHESHPGGVGLAETLYTLIDQVALDGLHALLSCPCQDGCPSCVGPPDREDQIKKQAARFLLETLAGEHVH